MFKPSLFAALCVSAVATLGLGSSAHGQTGSAAKPQVIAHRGASGYLPEHTLAGYELAVRMGADYLEPDLQTTRDGQLVAMHDATLERTTNVARLFAQRGGAYRVADFTLAEIQTLTVQPTGTAQSSFPGFTPSTAQPLAVPTLEEVIALAQEQSAASGREIGIYPEAKQADPAMEDGILRALQAHGYRAGSKLFIQSFSDATLRSLHAKQQAQGLAYPLVQLGYPAMGTDGVARIRLNANTGPELALTDVARYCAGVGVAIAHKTHTLTRAFIDQAHAAGLQVHGWTFAQPDAALAGPELRRFLDMGMDALFANYPDRAVAARNAFVARP